MFALEIRFLTGRYVATAYNDRREGEWPPHPARVFSALAAAHFESEDPPALEREALEWLERQAPPQISASEAMPRDVVTVFVPVNDPTTTAGVFEEAVKLAESGAALERVSRHGSSRERAGSEKKLNLARDSMDKAVRAATARFQGSPTRDALLAAKALLPEGRPRHARSFPAVTPSEPRVVLSWPDADPSAKYRQALDALAGRVVRVGHSSSLVSLRVCESDSAHNLPNWLPTAEGPLRLRVVRPQQIERLEQQYRQHHGVLSRVMPAAFQAYARASAASEPEPCSVLDTDWLVFRRLGGPRLPSMRAVDVTRALRGALMKHAPEPVSELLSGHRQDGDISETPHLAIVPLPFVASDHADGTILGIALVFPRDADVATRRAVYRAVDAWEGAHRISDEDCPRLPLQLGAAGVLEVQRVEDLAGQSTLRSNTWCGPARRWATATPVALDRNPGDLHAREPKEAEAAAEAAEQALRLACGRIGLPDPAWVSVLPAAPLTGVAKARFFSPFPREPGRLRRVLTHVALGFSGAVRGPILLGAGRYQGLGLFRPLRED